MPRKPPIVIVTIILSALILLATIAGLFNAIRAWEFASRGEISLINYLWGVIRATGVLLLPALTLYAAFRRPSWGYVITLVFAAFVLALTALAVLYPDPHPYFPIHGAAEEAGARVGRIFMIVAIGFYLARLGFGRKARDYYRQPQAPR